MQAGSRASGKVLDTGLYRGPVSPSIATLYDRTRFRNDGALTNVTWERQASKLWTMAYDGTAFATLATKASYRLPSATIIVWTFATDLTGTEAIWAAWNHGTDWIEFRFIAGSVINIYNDILNSNLAATVGSFTANTWKHCVITTEGDWWRGYIDGQLGALDQDMGVNWEDLGGAAQFYLGQRNADHLLSGGIGYFGMLNYAFTAGQVLQHFEATKHLFGRN